MAAPETFRALLAANANPQRIELPQRARHFCSKLNEYLYQMAHEPSLAGHRIQEHAYKTVPLLARDMPQIRTTTSQLDGTMFDLDYTSNFLDNLDDSIQNSAQTREIVSELASKVSAATSRLN